MYVTTGMGMPPRGLPLPPGMMAPPGMGPPGLPPGMFPPPRGSSPHTYVHLTSHVITYIHTYRSATKGIAVVVRNSFFFLQTTYRKAHYDLCVYIYHLSMGCF